MAKILQLETATQTCSVALAENGTTLALKELTQPNIHAGMLTLFIDEVMRTAGMGYADLDAVAVSMGPGSYTGLRIGVSTAKGLCYALEKPLIGVDTLQMMAAGFILENDGFDGLVCPMIDARRMEVFTAIFDHSLRKIGNTAAVIVDASSFSHLSAAQRMAFIGDGAAKCAAVLEGPHAFFPGGNYNSARHMSQLAYRQFETGQFEDVAYFEPFYLKDFVLTTPKKK